MIEETVEEFTTRPTDDNLVLCATKIYHHEEGKESNHLSVGENPQLIVGRIELCNSVNGGSVQIHTGDTVQVSTSLRRSEYERLKEWVIEHIDKEYYTVFENAVEQIEAQTSDGYPENQ